MCDIHIYPTEEATEMGMNGCRKFKLLDIQRAYPVGLYRHWEDVPFACDYAAQRQWTTNGYENVVIMTNLAPDRTHCRIALKWHMRLSATADCHLWIKESWLGSDRQTPVCRFFIQK